jgi:hypothetical protein
MRCSFDQLKTRALEYHFQPGSTSWKLQKNGDPVGCLVIWGGNCHEAVSCGSTAGEEAGKATATWVNKVIRIRFVRSA